MSGGGATIQSALQLAMKEIGIGIHMPELLLLITQYAVPFIATQRLIPTAPKSKTGETETDLMLGEMSGACLSADGEWLVMADVRSDRFVKRSVIDGQLYGK